MATIRRISFPAVVMLVVSVSASFVGCRPYEAERRTHCTNKLKMIVVALQNYHSMYKRLPPAYIADEDGKPMHSWRVLILPFMEKQSVYDQYNFDEPWDSPNNLALKLDGCYHCPSDMEAKADETSYVMIVGPGMISEGSNSVTFGDIKDGLSNTFAIVEVASSGIHWMEPRDLKAEEISFKINDEAGAGIGSGHPGGATFCMFDGSCRFIKDTVDPEIIEALCTIAGGEDVDAISSGKQSIRKASKK